MGKATSPIPDPRLSGRGTSPRRMPPNVGPAG